MDGKISSQNLIRQVNVEAPAKQPIFYKPLVFDILTVIAAAAAGYSYRRYLGGQFSGGTLVLALAFYALLSVLQVFLAKSLSRRFLFILLEVVALLFFFYDSDLEMLLIAAAIMLAYLFWGAASGYLVLENGLEIGFFKTAFPALKKITTALALMLILLYLPGLTPEKSFVSKPVFDGFWNWASGAVGSLYPGVKLNSTFGEFAASAARLELQNNPNFGSLSPANQDAAVAQAAQQAMAGFGSKLGQNLSSREQTSDVLYGFAVSALADWKAAYGNWFLVAWAVAAFLMVRGFGAIFYWLVGILAYIVYQILLSSGFIHLLGESRTHEIIEF